MFFFLCVLFIYVFHDWKIKKPLSKKRRKMEERKFTHENMTESLVMIIINDNWTETQHMAQKWNFGVSATRKRDINYNF